MKKSFLNSEKPILCAMVQCTSPEAAIDKIRISEAAGAEAFGIQLCKLKREYFTKENLTRIFAECGDKPIYVTNYRYCENAGCTDEECANGLLLALECGATLIDVFGDMFEESAKYQLAVREEAVNKQKALIEEIHRRGGEVLISSHTQLKTSTDENLMIAKAHAERGADVIKIVSLSDSVDDAIAYIESIRRITAETDRKLLLLVSGKARIIREIGPCFGVGMYLCVAGHAEGDTPDQPELRNIKAVRDNLRFDK